MADFPGFQPVRYTQVPDALFGSLLGDLSGVEFKVLMYVAWRAQREEDLPPGKRPPVPLPDIAQSVGTSQAEAFDALCRLGIRGLIWSSAAGYELRYIEESPRPGRQDKPAAARVVRRRPSGKTATLLRFRVFQRDGGICAQCKFDAPQVQSHIRDLATRVDDDGAATALAVLLDDLSARGFVPRVGDRLRSLWDADHIVPFCEGGSDDLENLRTLWTPCHKGATASLMRRLSVARKRVEHA